MIENMEPGKAMFLYNKRVKAIFREETLNWDDISSVSQTFW